MQSTDLKMVRTSANSGVFSIKNEVIMGEQLTEMQELAYVDKTDKKGRKTMEIWFLYKYAI